MIKQYWREKDESRKKAFQFKEKSAGLFLEKKIRNKSDDRNGNDTLRYKKSDNLRNGSYKNDENMTSPSPKNNHRTNRDRLTHTTTASNPYLNGSCKNDEKMT